MFFFAINERQRNVFGLGIALKSAHLSVKPDVEHLGHGRGGGAVTDGVWGVLG